MGNDEQNGKKANGAGGGGCLLGRCAPSEVLPCTVVEHLCVERILLGSEANTLYTKICFFSRGKHVEGPAGQSLINIGHLMLMPHMLFSLVGKIVSGMNEVEKKQLADFLNKHVAGSTAVAEAIKTGNQSEGAAPGEKKGEPAYIA